MVLELNEFDPVAYGHGYDGAGRWQARERERVNRGALVLVKLSKIRGSEVGPLLFVTVSNQLISFAFQNHSQQRSTNLQTVRVKVTVKSLFK